MKSLARILVLLLLAWVWLAAAPQATQAAIAVIAEPGADPAHLAMVQKTVDTFNQIIGGEMGVTLDRDVRVYVCPTRDSYRDVLRRHFSLSPDQADRSAKASGGFSSGTAKAVAVHFDAAGGAAPLRAYTTTAHELVHQLQFQLAGRNIAKSFYWLKEGMADLVGAAVAEKVGYQSLDKWKLDRANTLRKADKYVSPQDIITTDLDRWTGFIERKLHPYQVADLMVFYLMSQAKTDGYRPLAEYYRLLGQGVDNDAAFLRAFGLDARAVDAGFRGWFAELTGSAATIEIIAPPNVPAEYIADFNRGTALIRQFFLDNWGGDLRSSMRIVLAADKPAYAAALVKEFGLTAAEAEQRAKTSTWRFSGGTAVYDITGHRTKQQRIFGPSAQLASRFAIDIAPQKSLQQLYWLSQGACDAVAAHIVEQSGASTKDQYGKIWLASLTKAGAHPSLAELASPEGVNAAIIKYGADLPVRNLYRLAALYLLDKHGPAVFGDWFRTVRDTGSAETAFEKVFGQSPAQFYDEFAGYLAAALKKAA